MRRQMGFRLGEKARTDGGPTCDAIPQGSKPNGARNMIAVVVYEWTTGIRVRAGADSETRSSATPMDEHERQVPKWLRRR